MKSSPTAESPSASGEFTGLTLSGHDYNTRSYLLAPRVCSVPVNTVNWLSRRRLYIVKSMQKVIFSGKVIR